MQKQSVHYILTALQNLTERLEKCVYYNERESVFEQWKICYHLNTQSALHTIEFIFARPLVRLTLPTIEECMKKDVALLKERLKNEKESIAMAQKLHDSMMRRMKNAKPVILKKTFAGTKRVVMVKKEKPAAAIVKEEFAVGNKRAKRDDDVLIVKKEAGV